MLPGRRACIMGPLRRHFSQQITQHIAGDIFRIKVSEPKELGRNGQAPPIHADKLCKHGFVCGQPRRHCSCVTAALFAREHQPREPWRITQHRDEPTEPCRAAGFSRRYGRRCTGLPCVSKSQTDYGTLQTVWLTSVKTIKSALLPIQSIRKLRHRVELPLGPSTALANQDFDSTPQNSWKTLAKPQIFI